MTTEQNISKNLSSVFKTSILVRILAILLILALTFWAGMSVGYRKAEFSYHFSDRYYDMFDRGVPGMRGGMMGIRGPDTLIGGHGTTGTVLSASLPRILILDRDGTERTVIVDANTVIRSARESVASTTINDGNFIIVIGDPDTSGNIIAKLVRIMPSMMNASSSTFMFGRRASY